VGNGTPLRGRPLVLSAVARGRAVIAMARAGVIGHRSLLSSFPRPLVNDVRATLATLRGQGVIAHPSRRTRCQWH